MTRLWFLVALVIAAAGEARADEVPPAVRARAVRRTGAISVDGALDEAVWATAPKHTGFTQRFPVFGAKAQRATTFAIVYDDEALFVGVWAEDPEPDKLRRLLTRRDVDSPADAVWVAIDSYHDKRTAYQFQLNAAGVQRDVLMFDDTMTDDTWDAVWTGAVGTNATGWTAEFRIPLNQLRFPAGDHQQWGLQVHRFVARTQEQATWSPWPRTSDQTVSQFGIVEGIEKLRQARRLELLPYVSGGVRQTPIEAGDPLNDDVAAIGNVGLDVKYGIGPAFTLSATINPDFGQVEADPSQVNLSGNELFFAEKRPFFLEGVDLFRIPIGNGDGSVQGVFYSRRIGAAPTVDPDDYEYIDRPAATTIYGAAKLTGKTRSGWSVGVFDAVTGKESATIALADGTRESPVVAPLTNYAAARVKRDLRAGKTSIGASATAVNRALEGTGLEDDLHDQAYTGGLQISHRWADNKWQLEFRTVGSLVAGSPEAIANTQQLQRHLLQRPDARTFHFDPTRTQLTGFGATWRLGQLGDTKHWRYMFGGDLRTAGLELNDIGFQTSSDRAIPYLWLQYHDETPGKQVLSWQISGDVFTVHDELGGDPRLMDVGFECNAGAQLANYWWINASCNLVNTKWAAGALRGGPSLHVDPYYNGSVNVTTDTRKWLYLSAGAWGGRIPNSDTSDGGFDLTATIQARSNIDISIGPSWSMVSDPMQYVEESTDEQGRPHYVFARLRQQTAAMTARVNWTFSPKLSFQLYAQPFVSTGRYAEYKDVVNAGASKFADRFDRLEGTDLHREGDTYYARNSGSFSFSRPDFDFRQLRSTAVLRWEYRPGSSVFAIWSHGRTSSDEDGRFRLGRELSRLGRTEGENVVMVKANYWIGL